MRRLPWLGALSTLLLAPMALTASDSQPREPAAWFQDGQLTRQANQVLDALRAAGTHGLHAGDYDTGLSAAEIHRVRTGRADSGLRKRLDTALSASAARFVRHLHCGRVSARAAGFDLPQDRCTLDVEGTVRRLSTSADVTGVLASLEPQPLPYRMLKQALASYRDLARQPGLTQLPALPRRSVRPGDSYRGAPALRSLLVALGDLDPAAKHRSDEQIDPALNAAVQRFQSRHGLEPDGIVGPRTFAALTTPLAWRVRQIELSMERWRWVASLQRPDIVVNVPQFMLYALPRPGDDHPQVLEMSVIVGRDHAHTRTPIFLAAIEQVVFQPFWDIPSSIMRNELLPRIRQDPAYLERQRMEIVSGSSDDAKVLAPTPQNIEALAAGRLRLRQRPGPGNALGPVKFILPNPYNVYLHSTPEEALFRHARRTFSHGCIRVSEPAALAEYVLRNAGGDWSAARIDAALCGTQTLRVSLQTPVPVLIFYSTAAATQSRGVLFFEDVYDHDARLDRLLRESSQAYLLRESSQAYSE